MSHLCCWCWKEQSGGIAGLLQHNETCEARQRAEAASAERSVRIANALFSRGLPAAR